MSNHRQFKIRARLSHGGYYDFMLSAPDEETARRRVNRKIVDGLILRPGEHYSIQWCKPVRECTAPELLLLAAIFIIFATLVAVVVSSCAVSPSAELPAAPGGHSAALFGPHNPIEQ